MNLQNYYNKDGKLFSINNYIKERIKCELENIYFFNYMDRNCLKKIKYKKITSKICRLFHPQYLDIK